MIEGIQPNSLNVLSTNKELRPTPTGGVDLGKQFNNFLHEAMQKMNQQEGTVDKLTEQFIRGDLTDVHQILIASQKASLGLELTVQVRNKVVEAYQEVMRIQI